ncbi:helix-turn-helix domain-containing protein [Streptomyces sp. NPDC059949]|uniref:helix-turn-helix domain-containing protein n=1 Tax=Streptomyces sp. NPDC059949 TaxID=3347013 RepID=UPI00364CC30D
MSRILYPVAEVAQQLGVGLTTAKALVASGQLRSIKIGHSRRVPAEALHEFVRRLDAEQNGDGARVPALTPPVEAPSTVQS